MKALAVLSEKTASTYVQAFITALLIGSAIDVSTGQAAALAAIPAALTIVMNGLPGVPVGLPFYVDLTFRVLRTYVAGFLGFLVAMPTFRLSYSILQAAAAGALPAALAILKGGLASQVGDPASAALLPASVDPAEGTPVGLAA